MDGEASSWINFLQSSNEYARGVEDYLDRAFSTRAEGDQISCPCKECYHRFWHHRDEVYNHLISNGIGSEIKEWYFNENCIPSTLNTGRDTDNRRSSIHDDMESLLYDTHKDLADKFSGCRPGHFYEGIEEDANAEAKKFFKLVEDGKQELYPRCKSFSKLSFIIRLYLFKCVHGLTNTAFSDLLEIIQELIPEAKLPKSYNEARKLVKDLGLHYNKIEACRNIVCSSGRNMKLTHLAKVEEVEEQQGNDEIHLSKHTRKIPVKVVCHFPLKPRLQDSRNVRLGLTSDGFNPFRTMSTTHSTWPVVLINYNLPPWLFMKPEYLIMSLLIPGPLSPGNNIDVYLQPLMEELKDLWESGLETFDVSKHQIFQMRVALQSTTSDFPGYAMLSGWRTKGKYACPYCHYETDRLHLNHSKKSCYMGHRRFLDADHSWRHDKKSFNGKIEERAAAKPLTGTEVLYLLHNFKNKFGKTQPRNKDESCPWRKKSCFFDLPYWKHNASRHHLDAMHIEKNICDSVLGTLLDIPGKTKDHLNARLDLKEMGIRSALHLVEPADKRCILLPKASFSMMKDEKTLFCEVLKKAKLPQGCASNIARCVQTLPKHVALALIRLSAFFRGICNKVISLQDLDHLQCEIVEILCIFEKIFPPSFFDIMIHLPIHLVNEIKLRGPVSGWWMYPIERYLGKLKSYVWNRSRPEGSIAEGYLAEGCLIFYSRYLHDGVKKRSKNFSGNCEKVANDDKSPIFPKMGYPLGKRKKGKKGETFSIDSNLKNLAHRYVLFNCEDEQVEKYIK